MPTIYKRICNYCGKYYEEQNTKFCSRECYKESMKGNKFGKLAKGIKKSYYTVSQKVVEHCKKVGFKKGQKLNRTSIWKKKISETMKRLYEQGKFINPNKGKHIWNNKEHPRGMLGKHHSEETKRKFKKSWQEHRDERLKIVIKNTQKRPTSLEKEFMKTIEKYNLPFAYCGDGSLLIGFKNPDFYETNGKKICIEIRNKEVTERFYKINPEEYKQKRIEHFAKYGWKCLVFFEDELKDENKIKTSIEGASQGKFS